MSRKKKKASPPPGVPETLIVTDVLDLHGFYPDIIPDIVDAFIENAIDTGLSRLRIIHGKGRSRLKYEVHRTLEKKDRVARFYDAPPHLGGWGATIIEISPHREQDCRKPSR